jgi:hypothetical protein
VIAYIRLTPLRSGCMSIQTYIAPSSIFGDIRLSLGSWAANHGDKIPAQQKNHIY